MRLIGASLEGDKLQHARSIECFENERNGGRNERNGSSERASEGQRTKTLGSLRVSGGGDGEGGGIVRTGRVESTASEERAIYLPGANSGKLPSSSMIRL